MSPHKDSNEPQGKAGGGVSRGPTPPRGETNAVAENFREKETWQREAELGAEGRVVRWDGLLPNDYCFEWARTEDKGVLRAGCVYENARESWVLRCLLGLVEAELERARGMEFLGLGYRGVRYYDALMGLGGWWGWLREFGEELRCNASFGELDQKKLEWSLGELRKYFLAPPAVGLSFREGGVVEPQVLWPWQFPGGKGCGSGVTLEVRLGEFSCEEIAAALKELAGDLYGEGVVERRGTGKGVSVRSRLDALSAMRLASWYPKSLPMRSFRDGGWTAVSRFSEVRLGGMAGGSRKRKVLGGDLGHNEFDRYAARGRKQFSVMFPFGESAANALSWAQRQGG